MIMKLSIDEDDNLLVVDWDEKSPRTEADLHRMGGDYRDLNSYKFPLDTSYLKKVAKYGKSKGHKVRMSAEDKAKIKEKAERIKEITRLAQADSDAEVSSLLADQAPETVKLLRNYQRAGIKFMTINESSLLADDPGSGKAQPLSEPVLTPEGWKTMGDIKPGSQVIGSDGKPVNVLKVFPQGRREVVKVTFSDGTEVRCDWDHLWHTQNKREREITGKHKVLTTREMFDMGASDPKGRSRFSIPMTEPVQFSEKPFPIDPYTWGVLTGDGSLAGTHHASITTDHEIVENLVLPEGASAKLLTDHGWWGEYRLNGLSRFLREHNLNGTRSEAKVLPQEILYGSVSQRVAYLQGLLDTDGGTAPGREGKLSSAIEYGTVSKTLAYQVAELVQSLGGNATVRTKETYYTHLGEKRKGQLFYQMSIRLPEGIKPFRLKRKAEKWVPREKYQPQRWIRSIESTGEKEEMQCILVDSDDHLYLTTGYAVTHNTLQTIATMISSDVRGDILVLAPSSAINVTWPAEIKKWAPEDEVVRVVGTRKKREEALKCLKRQTTHKRRWILCNFDMARAEYVKGTAKDGTVRKPFYRYSYPHLFFLDYEGDQKNKREWSAVVVDEAHQVLVTTKSQPYKQTLVRCGMGKLSVVEGGKRIAITGTPFRGKTHNIWGLLNWMFPSDYKSYWKWVERWFNTSDNYFGGTEITEVAYGKSADFYRSLAPFMLRRTKKEIAPELPPKMYAGTIPDQIDRKAGQEKALIGHWLEMSPKQAKAYDEMVEFAMSNLDSGTLVANGVLAELTRLKQFSSCYGRLEKTYDADGYEIPKFVPEMPSNKYDWLVEFLDELGIDKNVDTSKDDPESRKVVVASQFTSIINLYEKELNKAGIETLKVTGGVKMEDREAAVKTFQSDSGPRVFMLNTIAGGVSLTLDRADDIVILDETFIPDDQEQVEDRIHRVSRNHNVTVHYVRSIGTVEEGIAIKTFERNNVNKQLIDGERGVDFARQILSSR